MSYASGTICLTVTLGTLAWLTACDGYDRNPSGLDHEERPAADGVESAANVLNW